KHLNRVLNGIAVRELVRLAEDVAGLIQQNGLGRRRAAVNAYETSDRGPTLKNGGCEWLLAIRGLEGVEISRSLHQALTPRLRLLLLAAEIDVVNELFIPAITTNAVVFGTSKFDRTQRGKVL